MAPNDVMLMIIWEYFGKDLLSFAFSTQGIYANFGIIVWCDACFYFLSLRLWYLLLGLVNIWCGLIRLWHL